MKHAKIVIGALLVGISTWGLVAAQNATHPVVKSYPKLLGDGHKATIIYFSSPS